ncbi:MAG: hypothetical protein ABWX63_04260 [Paeniglutamicibacter terrestris]
MRTASSLVTSADIDDNATPQEQISVSARLELVLTDGERIVLLDDRGWGTSGSWESTTHEELRETALSVVGPDEPWGNETNEQAVHGYWAYLSEILKNQGISINAEKLQRLPNVVELSPRLLARTGGTSPGEVGGSPVPCSRCRIRS